MRPGKECSWLFLIAASSVVLGGEHKDWCKYCANSDLVLVSMMLDAKAWTKLGGTSLAGTDLVSGIIHSPVLLHLLAHNTVRPL